MTTDAALSLLHVMIGVLVVGPLVVVPLAGAAEARASNAANVRSLARLTRVVGALALVVAGLGLALVPSVPELTIVTPWLGWSVLAYVAAIALVFAVITPGLDRASEQVSDGAIARTRSITVSAIAVMGLMAVVIVLMMWQP